VNHKGRTKNIDPCQLTCITSERTGSPLDLLLNFDRHESRVSDFKWVINTSGHFILHKDHVQHGEYTLIDPCVAVPLMVHSSGVPLTILHEKITSLCLYFSNKEAFFWHGLTHGTLCGLSEIL